jgi:hypothetical protein
MILLKARPGVNKTGGLLPIATQDHGAVERLIDGRGTPADQESTNFYATFPHFLPIKEVTREVVERCVLTDAMKSRSQNPSVSHQDEESPMKREDST